MLEGQDFFLRLNLIYSCNNLLNELHSCKKTSVCYKKTILISTCTIFLPFIYIDEFFHGRKT